jgi:nicotinamide-nucleotide amidase
MLEDLLPILKKAYAPSVFTRKTIYHLCGIPESAADEKLKPLLNHPKPGLEFTILGHPGLVNFHVIATGSSTGATERLFRWAHAQVKRHVGDYVFGTDDQTLESVIGDLLRRRGLTLAVAESCTAGLLSGRLTNVPGSSDYYLGGVISYADAVKQTELGVSRETLKTYGAVSEPSAREMAEGAMRRLNTDTAMSITGIAGPGGGSAKKPVGLTFIGLARQGRPTQIRRYLFSGSRDLVRERAVNAALALLLSSLKP